MATWKDILAEIHAAGSAYDIVRRKQVRRLSELTGRNVIAYYSGWLQKAAIVPSVKFGIFAVDDGDKNAFMAAIAGMDRRKGLDLVLHTPGGSIAATESIVEYLRSLFGTDIRAIVPQLAMSAGTLIAISCKEVLMGKQSSLGPIDPQIMGMPAHGVLDEFRRASDEVAKDPRKIAVWQPIIARYHPTLIGECEKAVKWSGEVARRWMVSGMFAGEADGDAKSVRIADELGDHSLTLAHDRHISAVQAKEIGVKVSMIEDDQPLQDAVLAVHHAVMQTFAATAAYKLIENQEGVAQIQQLTGG